MSDSDKTERDLKADDILSRKADGKPTKRYVEELGGNIYLRSMTAKAVTMMQLACQNDRKKLRQTIVQRVVCLSDGSPMFSREQLDDLGKVDAKVFEALFDQAVAHVGGSHDDYEDLDDAAGN